MKAITQDRFGDVDAIRVGEIPRPVPGEQEVLVEVRAAGCGPDVWHTMTGKPYLARPMLGFRRPKWPALGRDFSGVIAELGAGVSGFSIGDEVYGTSSSGSFADFSISPVTTIARKPGNVSFVEAAALPISGGTALQALQRAELKPGNRVLVIGAGGGVGSYATQIAVASGAYVTGMCSAGKAELVRSLGAAHVLDYQQTEVDAQGPVYDVIVDTAGNRPLKLLRRALVPAGTLLLVGGEQHAGAITAGFERQLAAGVLSRFTGQTLVGVVAKESSQTLRELADLVEAGKVRAVVGSTFPMDRAAAAIREVHSGHATGKVVVTIP